MGEIALGQETAERLAPRRDSNDYFVVDAVLHAYNFAKENAKNEVAEDMQNISYGLVQLTGDENLVSREQYLVNWSAEAVANLVFTESDVSVGVYHGVPWFDYFVDGMVDNAKGIEMHRRWPNRVLFYGTLDPTKGQQSVEEVAYLVEEGGACGIKLYPENYHYEARSSDPVMLDAPNVAPVLEKALEYKVPVAIHKAIPAGRGITDYYKLSDVEAAALRYPDLQIEVVHSGAAFLEETAYMLARYENIWANLEVTSAYVVKARRKFAEALGMLLASGAGDRILFATGAVLVHPQTVIDAFLELEMPTDLIEGFAVPPLSDELRAGILGGNFLRLHGRSLEDMQAAIADDEFAKRRRDNGGELRPRWSTAREEVPAGATRAGNGS